MKKIILPIILGILVATVVYASEFFPDIIVTGIDGPWVDARAYATLNAAVAAIVADGFQHTLLIADPGITTDANLVIPSYITLAITQYGLIDNTGGHTITFQNPDPIIAPNRRLWIGGSDIDFAVGTVVKSSWFDDLDSALTMLADDTVTLVITESETLAGDCAVPATVTLRWESPFIITSTGFNLTGLKNIEAGCYQIFGVSAADDFDFLAGSIVKSSWFDELRTAITTTADENVELTILVDQPETIDTNTVTDLYQALQVEKGCIITVETGDTFGINGPFKAGLYQALAPVDVGAVTFSDLVHEVYPQWWVTNTTPGTTNMAVAVQAAIDSVGSGGTIVITGLMGLGSAAWVGILVDTKDDITIIGTNRLSGFKTLIKPSQTPTAAAAHFATFLFDTCNYIEIKDLNFDGNNLDTNLIVFDTVSDSLISGNFIHNTSTDVSNGIFSVTGFRNKYLDNNITDCGRGMWIGNGGVAGQIETSSIIKGNTVWSNNHSGIGGHHDGGLITNNISIDNGGSGIPFGGSEHAITIDTIISNNVCKGNAFHGIQSDVVGGAYYTERITIVGNDCSENDGSGIYAVNVEDWTITGNICRDNNFDAAGSGRGIQLDTYARRVLVSGNHCYDTRAGAARTQGSGIYVSSDTAPAGTDETEQINITGNLCINNLTYGIAVINAAGNTIDSIHIGSNSVHDNGSYGIWVADAAATEVTNISIIGNQTLGNITTDLRIDTTIFAKIEENFFSTQVGLDPVAFTAADATPSVKGRSLWKTDVGGLTITMFDDGIVNQEITIISKGAVIYDVTGTNLEGGTTDLTTAAGDSTVWRFDGTNWYLVFFMDMSDNLS